MISLPGQLFLNTQIPCCLWFLTSNKTKNGSDRKNKTLFIDAKNLGTMKTRALKILTNKDIKKIQDTALLWRNGKNYKDIKGFCKSSTIEEIKKNDFVLSPSRYVGFVDKIDDGISFEIKMKKLSINLEKYNEESSDLNNKIKSNLSKIGF